jgi:hypothetical protein
MIPIRRAMAHIERMLVYATPMGAMGCACPFCGTRTIRDSQFAHDSDCPALMAEMFLSDAREAMDVRESSACVTGISPGASLTVTDSYGTHYLTPEGSLPESPEPDPVKFREWT